eukprot:Blabericola_migrator_1__4759@NODE_2503_length_2666_cov_869_538284_g1568_i0_p3_GENE_NODE_2503_length_2666_cov_869_538284_g1568_i0NODE_2503_length_2666_cov_869_538284_g1568_i0_p3_ORF_typecomplete_len126_score3_79DUF4518/PF15008_6/0_0065_NODE_2503_length_2666_cov_869_538284_g1568_i0596973
MYPPHHNRKEDLLSCPLLSFATTHTRAYSCTCVFVTACGLLHIGDVCVQLYQHMFRLSSTRRAHVCVCVCVQSSNNGVRDLCTSQPERLRGLSMFSLCKISFYEARFFLERARLAWYSLTRIFQT